MHNCFSLSSSVNMMLMTFSGLTWLLKETSSQCISSIIFWCQDFLKIKWRIFYGHAETQNFSLSADKDFTSESRERVKYFFNIRRDILYLQVTM